MSLSLYTKAENYIASYAANSKTTHTQTKSLPLKSMACVHHFLVLFQFFTTLVIIWMPETSALKF